jgi:predicted O-methyltransferase YrrM
MNFFYPKIAFELLANNLCKPNRKGCGIHIPLLLNFVTETCHKNELKDPKIDGIEKIRTELSKNKELISINDLGAGSLSLNKSSRKVCDILKVSSTKAKYGLLLHNIMQYCKPGIVIELGTCLGIGTMYLASGYEKSKVFTIEGSTSLASLAEKNLQKSMLQNINLIKGNFDDVLPGLLKENGGFDLMFIDGNHRKEAVLNYFHTSLPFANDNSLMIFDDIRWSKGMFEAWKKICKNKNIKLSLDLFEVGIIFFCKNLNKQHFYIYY